MDWSNCRLCQHRTRSTPTPTLPQAPLSPPPLPHRSEQMSSVSGLGSMSMRRCTRYTVVALQRLGCVARKGQEGGEGVSPGSLRAGSHEGRAAPAGALARPLAWAAMPRHPSPSCGALAPRLGPRSSPLRRLLIHGSVGVDKVGDVSDVHLQAGETQSH